MPLLTEFVDFVERGVGDSADLSARKADPNLASEEIENINSYLRASIRHTTAKIRNIKGEIPLNDSELLTDLGQVVCWSTVGSYLAAGLVFSSTVAKLAVSASSCLFFGGGKALAISNEVSAKQNKELTDKMYRIFDVYPELAEIMSAGNNPSSLQYRGH